MKKTPKFNNIRTLDLRHLPRFFTTAALFCGTFYLMLSASHTLTPTAAHLLLLTGSEKIPHITETDMARTLLCMSMPDNSLTARKEEPPSPPKEKEEATAPSDEIVIIPNSAQSITYESAEEKGYKTVDGIYINNQTKKTFDISALLNKDLSITLTDSPTVLIIHTHTTESYTPSAAYNYTPTETDRTTDLNYNTAAVGDVIYQKLTEEGINVIHDKTINDQSYSKSYSNSLKLAKSYIEKYPSIQIVIDVHRDAIITKEGVKLRPVTKFDPSCAQMMLVIGTNESGLDHSGWQTNLSFALKLQHKMNSLYPSLARPINLRRERFNQHTAPYAFILEAGTNGNTLEEAKKGAGLFAECLISILKE